MATPAEVTSQQRQPLRLFPALARWPVLFFPTREVIFSTTKKGHITLESGHGVARKGPCREHQPQRTMVPHTQHHTAEAGWHITGDRHTILPSQLNPGPSAQQSRRRV